MKKITLERISEQMRGDSLIEKLNSGETLTLEDLFTLQKYVSKKIEEVVMSEQKPDYTSIYR